MTQDVLYTTRWNGITRRPVAGHEWLNDQAARKLYESKDLEVVDASRRDADGTPKPRWVIGISQSGVRVQFFDEQMNTWHMVDWDRVDGRLWRWLTYDWEYSDATRHWEQKDATLDAEAMVRPDGNGDIEVQDRRTGQTFETEFSGRASEAFWLDYPEFGGWSALAEPGPSAYEVAGREIPAHVP
jgi:hypothetical protein